MYKYREIQKAAVTVCGFGIPPSVWSEMEQFFDGTTVFQQRNSEVSRLRTVFQIPEYLQFLPLRTHWSLMLKRSIFHVVVQDLKN